MISPLTKALTVIATEEFNLSVIDLNSNVEPSETVAFLTSTSRNLSGLAGIAVRLSALTFFIGTIFLSPGMKAKTWRLIRQMPIASQTAAYFSAFGRLHRLDEIKRLKESN